MRPLLTALVFVCASWPAFAETPAFDVLHYDVWLRPDFAAKTVSGTEIVRFKSLVDGLGAVSFSGNSLSVTASVDGSSIAPGAVESGRWVFRLPRVMRRGQVGRLVLTFAGAAPKGLVLLTAR
jgi:hypothetical protein